MTRYGFLWRAHFWTGPDHPAGFKYGGYYKFVRAWTPWGACRVARFYRHRLWDFAVERVGECKP